MRGQCEHYGHSKYSQEREIITVIKILTGECEHYSHLEYSQERTNITIPENTEKRVQT